MVGSDLEVTDKMMLRALARAERMIYDTIAAQNEDVLATSTSFSSTEIDAALEDGTGLRIPEHYTVLGGTVRYDGYPNDPDRPLWLVPAKMKDEMPEYFPAGYLFGQELFLIDRWPASDNDEWEEADTLTLRYLPVPEAPTRLVSELTIPDIAENYLTLAVADFMLTAMGQKMDSVTSQHLAARDALVRTLLQQDSTTTWRVRDVG